MPWSHRITISSLSAFILVATLSACQLRARLEVAPESTIGDLVFILTAWSDETPGKLTSVSVYRCIERGQSFPLRGERVWAARVKPGAEAPIAGRFAYGQNLGML